MPIREFAVGSIGDLSQQVKVLAATRRSWLLRGQADARWNLQPSVHRGYSAQQERYLTNEFRVRARSRHYTCPSSSDYPSWLALMQHYGLPTRLLDWSYSPLVAAFFSVHPDYVSNAGVERDACIWALDPSQFNASQGFEPLVFPLDAASYDPLIAPAFKNRKEPDTVGVAMTIEHDPRIQLQQGAFSIHSSRLPVNRMEGAGEWLCRFIIRNDCIADIHHELTLLGIRKYTLFPDLTSLTSELRTVHRPEDKPTDKCS